MAGRDPYPGTHKLCSLDRDWPYFFIPTKESGVPTGGLQDEAKKPSGAWGEHVSWASEAMRLGPQRLTHGRPH